MNPYLKLLRINVCVLAAFAVLVGALISSVISVTQIVLACFVAFIICGAGNVLNDYFDYEIDKINKPNRSLPSGKIKLNSALIYSIILFLIGNSVAFLYLNTYMLYLAIFNTFVIILYNYRIKRSPMGHFTDGYIGASPFLFGGLLASTITFPILILFLLGFLGNTGREIVKGLEDIEGDRKAKIRTLEIALGIRWAKYIAIMATVVAVMITPLPYLIGFFSLYYIPVVALADLLFIYSLTKINTPHKSQKIMKIAMFFAMFAFLAGML